MTERRDLDELAEVLAALPPITLGWTEEVCELYERTEREPDLPLTEELREKFGSHRTRQALSGRAHQAFRSLREQVEKEGGADIAAEAAALAERYVRAEVVETDAIWLLDKLGAPFGEEALLRLVADDSVDEYARFLTRERVRLLRRPRYEARAAQPVTPDEEPLLPESLREWDRTAPATPESFARARTVLEDLLPAAPLEFPEPPREWDGDYDEDWDERPQWLDVRQVMWALMPEARHLTRERLAEAQRECELHGLDIPEDFAERWTTRLAAWHTEQVFDWLINDYEALVSGPSWIPEMAERFVRSNFAAEAAVKLLRVADEMPGSREARDRILADEGVPPEIREQAR